MLLASAGAAGAGEYDFAYRLSGDQRVAPLQVFDDGASTWLQFQPGQAIPAIFEATAGVPAGRLVSYVQQGPYVVLNGTAAALVMRIGEVSARAEYQGAGTRQGIAASAPPLSPQWLAAPAAEATADVPSAPVLASTAARAAAGAHLREPLPQVESTQVPPPVTLAALEFDAALSDGNMRRVLDRWARQAGWMFAAEHWTVDVDIPLNGVASFGPDFLNAVRGLLATTEMTARPLQPCFYSNRVLRVVALTQPCDRTMAPGVAGEVAS